MISRIFNGKANTHSSKLQFDYEYDDTDETADTGMTQIRIFCNIPGYLTEQDVMRVAGTPMDGSFLDEVHCPYNYVPVAFDLLVRPFILFIKYNILEPKSRFFNKKRNGENPSWASEVMTKFVGLYSTIIIVYLYIQMIHRFNIEGRCNILKLKFVITECSFCHIVIKGNLISQFTFYNN